VVYGLMRTEQGVSRMSIAQELLWLAGYVGFELIVWGATWWFMASVIRSGPAMDTPLPEDGHQPLGTLGHGSTGTGERETPKATHGAAPGVPHPA
jgi:cytochrome bd ubiquinol oxidase subunit I